MSTNSIPSEEDFARAHAAMRERDQGLSDVRSIILGRFQKDGLHEAFIHYSPANKRFFAQLFFLRDDQIQEADKSGLVSQIKQTAIEEMERAGRGDRDVIKIEFEFEFDSHENVEANFDGDYFLRLR